MGKFFTFKNLERNVRYIFALYVGGLLLTNGEEYTYIVNTKVLSLKDLAFRKNILSAYLLWRFAEKCERYFEFTNVLEPPIFYTYLILLIKLIIFLLTFDFVFEG